MHRYRRGADRAVGAARIERVDGKIYIYMYIYIYTHTYTYIDA